MKTHLTQKPFLLIFFTFILIVWTQHAVFAAPRVKAAPSLIPKELKRTDIRNDYFVTGVKAAGVIQTVIGHVVVARGDMRYGYYAASGDRLYEKDVIFTLKSSRCRLKLIGEDVVTMGENTNLGIKTFQGNTQKSTKSSVFTMLKGKAMFYALRLFRYRSNAMVVETPTAVSGVRGTKWGVEVVELPGKEKASLPVLVADTSDLGFRLLAQANPPSLPMFQTTILCFSGTVFTGSTAPPPPGAPPPPVVTLLQGQMTTVGTGALPATPSTTPPSLANSFTASTFAPPPGDSGVPPPPPSLGTLPPPPPGPGGSSLIPATLVLDTSNLTQQQNQSQPSRPTAHEGFYVGMLTMVTSGNQFYITFISQSSQNFDTSQAIAYSVGEDFARMSTSSLEQLTYASGTVNRTPLPQPLLKEELGYNAYMEWGTWKQPNQMTGGPDPVMFDNKGYYVWGDRTATLPSSFSGTYTGIAHGTIWSNTGGIDQTKGTVTMNVSYTGGAGSINGFNLWVGSNTGISNGSGSFGTCGNYKVTGTSYIEGTAGSNNGFAYGNFYAPDAKWTGGVWMSTAQPGGVYKYANGNYVASRP